MTEWGVVGVLVVLIGLLGAILKPALKWNTTNTKATTENTMALIALTETIKSNEARNENEHGEIWSTIDKHCESITDHETRLCVIEKGGKK